jgi:catechol 2,3-dioxygenase-like lactoylglutathione lyase family enzyme
VEAGRQPVNRGGVHHIDLTVKDAHASRPFYESVLGFMGYRLSAEYPIGYDFDLIDDGVGFCSIGIRNASGPNAARTHDRYTSGLHHIAWTAASRADVDAMHAHLQKLDANITDAPKLYPEYGEGYYAVFFTDPDGLKLEYVYKPKN